MKIDIAGRRAIVAGGSRGIGRAIALAFAEAGAGVSICARGAEALATTRDEIARHAGVAHAAVCDLSDAVAIPRYIGEAADALGGIDILVNNASGFGTSDDEAGWAASISVDLLATVRATRAALPYLEKSEAGSILNISSISGFRASVRTGIDRISGRHLGASESQQSRPLRPHPQEHSVRPARPTRGNRSGCAVPVLAACQLGHRPEHRRRWRADAVRPMRLSSSAAVVRRR
jgi:NAD(P)-dependent dehydrogenase (short-subunit alcohol dehydrogenase family)